MFISLTAINQFTNGYEDSKNINFARMTTKAIFQYIDKCKKNAFKKNSPYWLGMAEKAERAARARSIRAKQNTE